MGSQGALRAGLAVPTTPLLAQGLGAAEGCRGAPVGGESLHVDSGGRGEYGAKKKRHMGERVWTAEALCGGRFERHPCASLCKVLFVVGLFCAHWGPGQWGLAH